VFFHGNGATLERDVRDRQLVPQQIRIQASMPCCWRRNWRSTPRFQRRQILAAGRLQALHG